MAKSSEKDREAAKYMKAHPGRFPDSYMRPWPGNGAGIRQMAMTMGAVPNNTTIWDFGMLGGVLCARLGMGSANVADEFRRVA